MKVSEFAEIMQAALNTTALGLAALNEKASAVKAAVLQNRLGLYMIAAAQGGCCAFIKQGRRIYVQINLAS